MSDLDPTSKLPYLRRITIIGDIPGDDGPPVHVTHKILLDGVEHPDLIDISEGWTVHGGTLEASTVSFSVPADRATPPQFDDAGNYTGGSLLDGIPVLSPTANPWEMYQPRDKPLMVRVYAFVAAFEILPATKAEVPA
jgi:hypothetical protein